MNYEADIDAAIDLMRGIDPTADPNGIAKSLLPILETIRPILQHERDQSDQIAYENANKTEDEDVSGDFLYAVYDQRNVSRAVVKWYSPRTTIGDRTGGTRLTKKRGVCFHHTAVYRGFGVDRSIVARYLSQSPDASRLIRTSRALANEELARVNALAHRFRGDPSRKYNEGVPYHAIMAANSVLYLNLPFDWVTWHGDGSNTDFLGVAWDALSSKEAPPADDLIADGVGIIDIAREEGHPISELTVHAAWTNKPNDPGAAFIREVIEPIAESTKCLIRYDFKAGPKFRSINEILKAA